MLPRVVILVPAYNAGRTVERVFARIPPPMRERIDRYVVVDDGSTDDTAAALERLRAEFPSLLAVTHPRNLGYGDAIKTLLTHARECAAGVGVVLHADGQYSPEALPELLAPFDREEADLVQGSRMLGGGALRGGMPLYKFIANKALTAIENAAFGMTLAEYHSGYMLYSAAALQALPFEKLSASFDIDLELIVMARVLGLRLKEVAIPTIYAGEVSHLRPVEYGLRVLKVVRRYRQGYYHALV